MPVRTHPAALLGPIRWRSRSFHDPVDYPREAPTTLPIRATPGADDAAAPRQSSAMSSSTRHPAVDVEQRQRLDLAVGGARYPAAQDCRTGWELSGWADRELVASQHSTSA